MRRIARPAGLRCLGSSRVSLRIQRQALVDELRADVAKQLRAEFFAEFRTRRLILDGPEGPIVTLERVEEGRIG